MSNYRLNNKFTTRSRSGAMSKALKADDSCAMMELMRCDVLCPPEVTSTRVRKLGRVLKDRSEECTWMDSMRTSEADESEDLTCNAAAVASEIGNPRGPSLSDNPTCQELIYHGQGEGQMDKDVQPHADMSLEDQLDDINRQRKNLDEREMEIKAKLKQFTGEPSEMSVLSENPTECDVTGSQAVIETAGKPTFAQGSRDMRVRRLKGSAARSYASRDEGTLGSILWTCGPNMECDDHSTKASSASSSKSSVPMSRRFNLKQDDSETISELMRHSAPPDNMRRNIQDDVSNVSSTLGMQRKC